MRRVTHQYRDPLSEIWLAAAHKIGLRVERSDDAFAHSDGKGTLVLATSKHLDADDCVAQMVFHELCHSLVEGPESFSREDWGLDNTDDRHNYREHATLRVQAKLSQRWGLREVFGPTTDFRSFYDSLGADPLEPRGAALTKEDEVVLAVHALQRSRTHPWWPHLDRALAATASIIETTKDWAAPADAPSLYRLWNGRLPRHPSGLFTMPSELGHQCGECAWRGSDGHCQQVDEAVGAKVAACERFEPPFDCQDCGACCRAAYHSVTITEGDPVVERHPQLVVHHESYSEIRRDGDHCAALVEESGRFSCTIYDDRPTCCREFENAGAHCVTARRRLGYSL